MERPRSSHLFRKKRSVSEIWVFRPQTSTPEECRDKIPQYQMPLGSPSNSDLGLDNFACAKADEQDYVTRYSSNVQRPFTPDKNISANVELNHGPKRKGALARMFRSKSKHNEIEDSSEEHRAFSQERKLGERSRWLRRAKGVSLKLPLRPHLSSRHESRDGPALRSSKSVPLGLRDAPALGLVHFRGGAAARAAAAAASSKNTAAEALGIIVETDRSDRLIRRDPACLPPEIFSYIISFLSAEDIVSSEAVSRLWCQTASAFPIWRNIFLSEFQRVPSGPSPQDQGRIGEIGLGKKAPEQNWKLMWKARRALDARWNDGHAAAIYLNGHKDSVYCVQFDENVIVTGSRDRTIRVWDLYTFRCLKVLGIPNTEPPLDSPPSCKKMGAQKPFETVLPAHYDPPAVEGAINHRGSILCLEFDSTIMVTGSSDCTIIVWDVKADYKPTLHLRNHTFAVLDISFDSQHIVSSSKDHTIDVWERSTGILLRTLTGHQGPVNAVQLRGQHLVSGSGDSYAKLWNVNDGKCIKSFQSRKRGLACVEFSDDSRTILAGGNDKVVYQFDTGTGNLVREIKGHTRLVRSLHLDSLNGRLISGSYDYSVKAYDTATGRLICDFEGWTTSWMLSAKADYRRIVATSQDGKVVVMDFGYGLKGIEHLAA